jgi:multimeric flavodoxin WrbA
VNYVTVGRAGVKVLGICGSPRKGNTEWMLTTVLNAVGDGAETELLLLRMADVRTCRGCLSCEQRDESGRGSCRIEDDMQSILPKLLAADVIVLGTPGYMSLLSGLLKNFLDRTCPIWPALSGKAVAGVAVAEESVGAALRNLRTYGDLLHMRWLGGVAALAKLPKEASRQPALARRLERLGRLLSRSVTG